MMVTAPLLVPPAVGSNVTLRVQMAPAARLERQVLVWEKSPLAVILVIVKAGVPVFVSVTL
jgi:hypothetical protein